MKFELDDDQREFRALLRAFVDKEIIPVAVSGSRPADTRRRSSRR